MTRINFLSNCLTKKDQVNNHPFLRYAAVLFMVFVVGIGQAWG